MVNDRSADGKPFLAFYGDDFTGASENMAQFHRHGLSTFMFLGQPDPTRFLEIAARHNVVGVAGVARALPPDRMAEEVEPVFRLFARAGIRFVQYKLCSTFDSSPHIGNLATVIGIGRRVFGNCFVPVFAAMPEFGRYTAFGNHFAQFGAEVHRLDRHASMSRHPVTPMHEADLRLVLREQGCGDAGLLDLRALQNASTASSRLAEERRTTTGPIVFDGTEDEHCATVAGLIWTQSTDGPVLALAAQGLANGLGRFLSDRRATPARPVEALRPVERLLVLSGSCSPRNGAQLRRFEREGAELVRLPASLAVDPRTSVGALADAVAIASEALRRGRSACIFTALGPDDPETPALRQRARELGLGADAISERVGEALGQIGRELIQHHGLPRVAFAGGDTSSFALRSMSPEGLAVVSGDYATGAHVFRTSGGGFIDGLEVVLKGGQVGSNEIFNELRDGRPAA